MGLGLSWKVRKDGPNPGPKLWAKGQSFPAPTPPPGFWGSGAGSLLAISSWASLPVRVKAKGTLMSTFPLCIWTVWKAWCGDWEKSCPCLFWENQKVRMVRGDGT